VTGLKSWPAEVTFGRAEITENVSERERAAAISIAWSVKGVRRVTSHDSAA